MTIFLINFILTFDIFYKKKKELLGILYIITIFVLAIKTSNTYFNKDSFQSQ